MKLYYYRAKEGNFGDDLNAWLWERLLPGCWNSTDEILLCGIGTILWDGIPDARHRIVFSSGTGYGTPTEPLVPPDWHVICVRGPLTASKLNLPAEKAITDGAIMLGLLPEYAPIQESDRQGIVCMPHHGAHLELWKQVCYLAGFEFIDPRQDGKKTIERLQSARLVLADAMHAAIVADTLRVPWIPITSSTNINEFKWTDWAFSMELPYSPFKIQNYRPKIGKRLRDFFQRLNRAKQTDQNHLNRLLKIAPVPSARSPL